MFGEFTLQNFASKSEMCKPTFYTFFFITSELKQYYETLYLSYRPRTECSISQFSLRQLALSQYSGRSIVGFRRNRSKISKITHTAGRFSFLTSAKIAVRAVRFNIMKNLLRLFFLFNGFITMCNLKQR